MYLPSHWDDSSISTWGAGMLMGAAGSAGCDMEPRGEAKMSALLLDGCAAPGGAAAPPGAVGT